MALNPKSDPNELILCSRVGAKATAPQQGGDHPPKPTLGFLNLPPEIRCLVYHELFFDKGDHWHGPFNPTFWIDLMCHDTCLREEIECMIKKYVGILRTCSAIHNEATRYLYQRLIVEVDDGSLCSKVDSWNWDTAEQPVPFPSSLSSLKSWLLQIGARNCSNLKNMRIVLGHLHFLKADCSTAPETTLEEVLKCISSRILVNCFDLLARGHNLSFMELYFKSTNLFQAFLDNEVLIDKLRALRTITTFRIECGEFRDKWPMDQKLKKVELETYMMSPLESNSNDAMSVDARTPRRLQQASASEGTPSTLLKRQRQLMTDLSSKNARISRLEAELSALRGAAEEDEHQIRHIDACLQQEPQ